jgi:precorrin-6B methylase 1
MANPSNVEMIRLIDGDTDEVIDREMNAEELAKLKEYRDEEQRIAQELQAKEASKLALLERLGITAEEAALLLG